VDGTYILELHKDEKKGEAKATIVMDFCTEVVRVSFHYHLYKTTNSMELSPSWEDYGFPATQEIPSSYGTQSFITVFLRDCH
jgi:hypothetical protein